MTAPAASYVTGQPIGATTADRPQADVAVCDFRCWGAEHAAFNAAFLATVMAAFPVARLTFYSEEGHAGHVHSSLAAAGYDPASLEWRLLQPPPRRAPFWTCASHDVPLIFGVLQQLSRANVRHVFVTGLSISGIAATKLFAQIRRPRYSLAFVHHGALATLMHSRRWTPFLTLGNSRIRQIVLGAGIRERVVNRFPQLENVLASIPLPYLFPPNQEAAPSTLRLPLGFAFLGLTDEAKGFQLFVDLAKHVHAAADRRAVFQLIGHFTPAQSSPAMERWRREEVAPWVDIPSGDGYMDRAEYERKIMATSYAIMPFDPDEYSLIASASLLDCFTALKPWIALRNPEFERLHQQLGDVGYLCDTREELFACVLDITTNPPAQRYAVQQQNLLRGRELFTPAAIAPALRQIAS